MKIRLAGCVVGLMLALLAVLLVVGLVGLGAVIVAVLT